MPAHYLGRFESAVFREYQSRVELALASKSSCPEIPESLIRARLNNTWHDTACAVVGNWIGLIYQITHKQRNLPFMDGVDMDNPLNL